MGGNMDGKATNVDIETLRRLEDELKTDCASATSSVHRDAKVNMLKFCQVETVLQYQAAYDALYYELNKQGGLECLRSIAPARSKDLMQPKILELQGCDEEKQLEKQLQFYLAEAELAKQTLDDLVAKVARDSSKYDVRCVDVKSPDSTRRKARRFCGGDVRKVADMARVTVICEAPEALKEAYLAITESLQPQDILRVANGFNSDWMPGGYRDVKVNPVVNEHLCEIQLQLRDFFALKNGQHAVYEWARELDVTTELRASDLFKNLSGEVMEEMISLAQRDWYGTGYCLPDLQLAAGQYDLAEKSLRQKLLEAEAMKACFQDNGSGESRRALLRVNTARARLGVVLQAQGKYDEAEPLCLRAIDEGVETLGPDHPDIATRLNNRAGLLKTQCKYAEARPLFERCQAIQEKTLGPEHPRVALTCNNLAVLLREQGRLDEAGPLYDKAIAIAEKALGAEHPDLAVWLNNRADLLNVQGKYADAAPLYRRSLSIREKALGPGHPEIASALNNFAGLLENQGNFIEADPLYLRAIEIGKKTLGAFHPTVGTWLNNRAKLLRAQGKYDEAGAIYMQVAEIDEKSLGPDHPDLATSLNNQALLLEIQGKYAEAAPLYERSLAIREKVLGPEHMHVAQSLNNWAGLLESQEKYEEALPFYVRAVAVGEKVLGPEHPSIAVWLSNQAGLLEKQGKFDEADPLYLRAIEIGEKKLGPNHPDLAAFLNNRARLLIAHGKLDEAGPLCVRAIATGEKALGPEHQFLAVCLNNQAGLLEKQGKFDEADPLYLRAYQIALKVLGPDYADCAPLLNNRERLLRKHISDLEETMGQDHPDVATFLEAFAEFFEQQEKYTEALPLLVRALSIRAEKLGENHPDTVSTQQRLEMLQQQVQRRDQRSCM